MTRSEAEFLVALERAINSPARNWRVWRQQAGRVRLAGGRWMQLAPEGAADLTGYCDGGVRLEVEAKAANGRQSAAQRRWQALCERAGVVYVLVHDLAGVPLEVSVAAALARIDAAIGAVRCS